MIAKLRTYRSLSTVLATVLLLSAGLPLVRHACGAAEEAGAMKHFASPAVQAASRGAMAHCVHGHADVQIVPCANVHQSSSACESATCVIEAEEQAPAVNAERSSLRLDLAPVLIAKQALTHRFASSLPVFQRSNESAEARRLVAVRLLISSFLL